MDRPDFADRVAVRAWNETLARRYDPSAYHNHPSRVVRVLERARVRKLLALLDIGDGHRVLEVGCGAGDILDRIRGAELHGIDLSPWLLEKAAATLGARASLREGWAEELPYSDSSFDRVFASEVLEHVVDPESVLREMRRVVAPSGRVALSFPNEPLIDRIKDVLVATRLWSRFSGERRPGYRAARRMEDEWHLHQLNPAKIAEMTRDRFRVELTTGVPTRLFPIRFVMALVPI